MFPRRCPPLLIRLHSGNFTFADAKPDGTDIRFMSADGKLPLKFHVEQFDAANELGVAWVMVPKITANAKTDSFVMEWGNPGAPPAAWRRHNARYNWRRQWQTRRRDPEFFWTEFYEA